MSRLPYTLTEKKQIVQYIIDTRSYYMLRGTLVWKNMEKVRVCGDRTWQSMKENFRKSIVHNLYSLNIPKTEIELIRNGFNSTAKPTSRFKLKPTSAIVTETRRCDRFSSDEEVCTPFNKNLDTNQPTSLNQNLNTNKPTPLNQNLDTNQSTSVIVPQKHRINDLSSDEEYCTPLNKHFDPKKSRLAVTQIDSWFVKHQSKLGIRDHEVMVLSDSDENIPGTVLQSNSTEINKTMLNTNTIFHNKSDDKEAQINECVPNTIKSKITSIESSCLFNRFELTSETDEEVRHIQRSTANIAIKENIPSTSSAQINKTIPNTNTILHNKLEYKEKQINEYISNAIKNQVTSIESSKLFSELDITSETDEEVVHSVTNIGKKDDIPSTSYNRSNIRTKKEEITIKEMIPNASSRSNNMVESLQMQRIMKHTANTFKNSIKESIPNTRKMSHTDSNVIGTNKKENPLKETINASNILHDISKIPVNTVEMKKKEHIIEETKTVSNIMHNRLKQPVNIVGMFQTKECTATLENKPSARFISHNTSSNVTTVNAIKTEKEQFHENSRKYRKKLRREKAAARIFVNQLGDNILEVWHNYETNFFISEEDVTDKFSVQNLANLFSVKYGNVHILKPTDYNSFKNDVKLAKTQITNNGTSYLDFNELFPNLPSIDLILTIIKNKVDLVECD